MSNQCSVNKPVKIVSVIGCMISALIVFIGMVLSETAPQDCDNVLMCIVNSEGFVNYNHTETSCTGKPNSYYYCEWDPEDSCPEPSNCDTKKHQKEKETATLLMIFGGVFLFLCLVVFIAASVSREFYMVKKENYVQQP